MKTECFKCKKLIEQKDVIMVQQEIFNGWDILVKNIVIYFCNKCYKLRKKKK